MLDFRKRMQEQDSRHFCPYRFFGRALRCDFSLRSKIASQVGLLRVSLSLHSGRRVRVEPERASRPAHTSLLSVCMSGNYSTRRSRALRIPHAQQRNKLTFMQSAKVCSKLIRRESHERILFCESARSNSFCKICGFFLSQKRREFFNAAIRTK